jgi:DNA-binding CsgD family transcriptional regulator
VNEINRNVPMPELSPRQQQILKLLQAGKVNKDVAQELGIGLGTVKQHIVAIFKKLNVSNRAMAATQALGMQQEKESRAATLPMADLLECRPCVVLSIALPPDAGALAAKLMYGSLAALASANDAVFLARNGNAGDLIFGIQRVTEYDLAVALQTARAVYDDLLALDAGVAEKMHGCMTAGIAFASMKRYGGWTGEAIASAAIASARELLGGVPAGNFLFDGTALDLIELFGISGAQQVLPCMQFGELKNLHWSGARRAYHLIGRETEMDALDAALAEGAKGTGRLIVVEGEMGMGKSSLCDELATRCIKQGGAVSFSRSMPSVLGQCLYDITKNAECTAADVAALLRAQPAALPELAIVDDFHLLPKEQQELLSIAAQDAVGKGKLVVFAGRRWMHGDGEYSRQTITLRRLSAQSIQTLVRNVLGKGAIQDRANKVQRISSAAAGVPLFAVELARHHDAAQLTLPLRVAINARLDSLHLDRNVLREVAKNASGATLGDVAAKLGEQPETLLPQIERAIAAGVLACSAEQWLSFTHPLLRSALSNEVME